MAWEHTPTLSSTWHNFKTISSGLGSVLAICGLSFPGYTDGSAQNGRLSSRWFHLTMPLGALSEHTDTLSTVEHCYRGCGRPEKLDKKSSDQEKIGQKLPQTKKDLEKGTAHATLTLQRNPSGVYQTRISMKPNRPILFE